MLKSSPCSALILIAELLLVVQFEGATDKGSRRFDVVSDDTHVAADEQQRNR